MLIKIPGAALVDDVEICRNMKLNIPNGNQFRLKAEYLEGEEVIPLDLLCDNWSFGVTKKLQVSVKVKIIDMISKTIGNLEIGYDPFKRNWIVSGTYGSQKIDMRISMIFEVFGVLVELYKGHNKINIKGGKNHG